MVQYLYRTVQYMYMYSTCCSQSGLKDQINVVKLTTFKLQLVEAAKYGPDCFFKPNAGLRPLGKGVVFF